MCNLVYYLVKYKATLVNTLVLSFFLVYPLTNYTMYSFFLYLFISFLNEGFAGVASESGVGVDVVRNFERV